MSDTTEPGLPAARPQRDSSVLPLIKRIHPRHVIWVLLLALFALVTAIGKYYDGRLGAMEVNDAKQTDEFRSYQKTQNGHLHSIDLELREIKSEQKYTRETMEKIERRLR